MDTPAWWLFLGVGIVAIMVPGAVVIGLLILATALGRRTPRVVRQAYQRMEHWAREVGWQYRPSVSWHERIRGGPFADPGNLTHLGTAPRSGGACWGSFGGLAAATWDYSERYKSDSRPRRRWHIVSVTLPGALPPMELRQMRTAPGPGMSFEDEEFNALWRVTAVDPRLAYGITNPRMIERLKREDMRGRNFLIHGDRLLLWREGLIDPRATDEALRLLAGLLPLIPRHVWDDAARR